MRSALYKDLNQSKVTRITSLSLSQIKAILRILQENLITRRDYDICKFVKLFSCLQNCLGSCFYRLHKDIAVTHQLPPKSFAIYFFFRRFKLFNKRSRPFMLPRPGNFTKVWTIYQRSRLF